MRYISRQPKRTDKGFRTTGMIIALVLLLSLAGGCDRAPLVAPREAVSATPEDTEHGSDAKKELVQITSEKITQSGIVVEPVARGVLYIRPIETGT